MTFNIHGMIINMIGLMILDISDVLELNNNEIYDYIESCIEHGRVEVLADISISI